MTPISEIYDLGIIGGGIAGAAIARDAALRGCRVVLFEKNTFASGTSSKSSKLIHGGLRYLETAWHALKKGRLKEFWKNFRFVFLALRETHILRALAPDLIRPIPLLVPIYRSGKRKPLAVYFGTFFYGVLARITGGAHFPQLLLSKESVLKKESALNPEGLLGGVLIWDHTTDDTKLVNAVMASAQRSGAMTMEHAEVKNFSCESETGSYVIQILKDGAEQVFRVRKIINAAGPWVDQVRALVRRKPDLLLMPIAGAHLNMKPFCQTSVILEAEDGRVFFVIRRENDCRVGTTERVEENPDSVAVTAEETEYMLRTLRKIFPGISFQEKDILSRDAGVRPLVRPKAGQAASDISREHEFVKDETGVIHILGVKLTDHRRAAEELMTQIVIPELRARCPEAASGPATRHKPLAE